MRGVKGGGGKGSGVGQGAGTSGEELVSKWRLQDGRGSKGWDGKEARGVKGTATFLTWVSGECWGARPHGGEPEMDGPLM